MATLMRVYVDEAAAQRAAQSLMAAGVPGSSIQLMTAPMAQAVGNERIGTFDNEDASLDREGTFDDDDANTKREGSFDDTSGHRHNVREEPRGTFATGQSVAPPTLTRLGNRSELNQALASSGIAASMAERHLAGMQADSVVLLVETGSMSEGEIEALL